MLVGPRATFAESDPFLAGGGAVDLVDLDEVVWTEPPDREEAGTPNVVGAVALAAAIGELTRIGWSAITAHDEDLAARLHAGLGAITGVRILGPTGRRDLPLATFTVDGLPHALLAARLSAEHGIGVRHGCFCAHPYLLRLLGLTAREVTEHRDAALAGDRREIPGAVRASAGVSMTRDEIDRFLAAVRSVATEPEPPVPYDQDAVTSDYWPLVDAPGWTAGERRAGAPCSRG